MKLADRVTLAWGWRRWLIAFLAGAFGALAMAPFNFFPAMIVPMVASVWLIDSASRSSKQAPTRRFSVIGSCLEAARDGWWLGFGYFVAGLWWLGAAFLVEAQDFAWLMPLGVAGLPAVLAVFMAVGFFLARLLWSSGPGRLFALAFALSVSEWLRGHVATGFPWNEIGMSLGGNLLLAQGASLIGLYGLNFLTVLIFAAPACWFDRRTGRGSRAALAGALGLLAAIAVFGAYRLSTTTTEFVANVQLRIMQPNLPQDEKFRSEFKEDILRNYLALSDRATSPQTSGVADATHLIWPESAFPFILSRDRTTLARLGAFLGKTVLVTGAARIGEPPRSARLIGEMRTTYFNSVQVLANGGEIVDTYDKAHLVPFGEYLPLSGVLERLGLRHFVHIPGGFEPGESRRLLSVPGLPPVAALVCYEAIFPGEVVPAAGQRPGLLLNVTNDGWFGNTAGPYQHFSQARLRAIEEGLPLVRAANTGISAILDPQGRVIRQLPLGVAGVLDRPLPRAATETFFSRHPWTGPLILLFFSLFAALAFKISSR